MDTGVVSPSAPGIENHPGCRISPVADAHAGLTVLGILSVLITGPVRSRAALQSMAQPNPEMQQYLSPEQLEQMQSGLSISQGPLFIYGFPTIVQPGIHLVGLAADGRPAAPGIDPVGQPFVKPHDVQPGSLGGAAHWFAHCGANPGAAHIGQADCICGAVWFYRRHVRRRGGILWRAAFPVGYLSNAAIVPDWPGCDLDGRRFSQKKPGSRCNCGGAGHHPVRRANVY